MTRFGRYTVKGGKTYDLLYFEDEKMARSIGPLLWPEVRAAFTGVVSEVSAESEEEALQKLAEALGEGTFEKLSPQ